MSTRRHLLAAAGLLAFVLASPARADPADPATFVDLYLAAWNSGHAGEVAKFFAKDAEFFDVTVGKPQTGRQNIQDNVVQPYLTAVPDLHWAHDPDKDRIVVDKDGAGVAFEWILTGTNKGNWSDGTEATGNSFKIRGLTVLRLIKEEDSTRIGYEGDYYDALGFYQQLGLME
jgi:steroid delta-isomerase-like uncharacterized protein